MEIKITINSTTFNLIKKLSKGKKIALLSAVIFFSAAITLMAKGLITFSPGNVLTANDLNHNFSMMAPVGAVIAWHKNMELADGKTQPALPPNFVECNGQVLNDPESPYNGKVIPNLNGVSSGADSPNLSGKYAIFLRGGINSGVGQDDATAKNGLSIVSVGDHVHGPGTYQSVDNYYDGSRNDLSITDSGNNDGKWSDKLRPLNPQTQSGEGGGHTHALSEDYETRPVNMSVVWIMRIK